MIDLARGLIGDIINKKPCRSLRGVMDTISNAYDVQDVVSASLGPLCGRKIAMNSPPLLAAAQLDEPIVGNILGATALPDGAQLRISDYAELAIEPEFAAVLGADVPAGTVLERTNVSNYLSRVSLAFEILDKRNVPADLHGPTFVANNVFNAGVVLSDVPLDVAQLETGAYSAHYLADGVVKLNGKNTAPQNPIDALLFVINTFSGRGITIKAGEIILCGTHYPPETIETAGVHVFSLSCGAAVNLSIST